MNNETKKRSIAIFGASGGVGQALLNIFDKYRFLFQNVVLVDKNDFLLSSKTIKHEILDYVFLKKDITEGVQEFLLKLKKDYDVSIVLDLTDSVTLPTLSACDKIEVNYLNCSVNYESSSMLGFSEDMKNFSRKFNTSKHVLSLGMNPGVVNHMLIKGVLEYGVPLEFVEIEFDSGIPANWKNDAPFITWSKTQFLNEIVRDPSGLCGENGIYKEFDFPAIQNTENTEKYLLPVIKLEEYPLGMIVPHDEIITMSRVLEVPGRFVYAIHPKSLSMLKEMYSANKKILEDEICFCDNVDVKLEGSDLIGVWLYYDDLRVCYYTEINHKDVMGTNATLFLVAVGVVAGLVDFITNPSLERGVMSALDLNNETFLQVVKNHISIKKIIKKI